jgi:phosphoribosylanthranilate isomerase
MPLKTLVKISGVTNLSDARYCAGMGVDMLGFSVIEGHKNYIPPQQFQQIRGWVTGPLVVAELAGIRSQSDLGKILDNYRPDMLELGVDELALIPSPPLPYILKVKTGETIVHLVSQPAYLLSPAQKDLPNRSPLLLEVHSQQDVREALSNPSVNGIALNGSPELKPGLKDYSDLAEILEHLEMD